MNWENVSAQAASWGFIEGKNLIWQHLHDLPALGGEYKGTADITVAQGETFELQINTESAFKLQGASFTLRYNSSHLTLNDFAIQSHDGEPIAKSLVRVMSNSAGCVNFACDVAISAADMWSGLVTRLKFTAKVSGATTITLEGTGAVF